MIYRNLDVRIKQIIIVSFVLWVLGVLGCQTTSDMPQTPEVATDYIGKKIMWVDSYHEGYEWSDGIEQGIRRRLEGTGVTFKAVRMDTKRNTDERFIEASGLKTKEEIEAFAPDVLIASDDNAQKYLVVPFLKDTDLPVVFAGVNWDATPYGYPTSNVTGMIEVDLVQQIVEHLKPFADGERVGVIAAQANTEKKIVDIYSEIFFVGKTHPYFVTNFDEFKAAFVEAQNEVDILILVNDAGIEGWDVQEAEQFVLEHARIPLGGYNEWMTPYVLLSLARVPDEQGEWAAQAALQILAGTSPAEIPIVQNKRGQVVVNLNLVNKLDVVFPPSLLKNAEVYGDE